MTRTAATGATLRAKFDTFEKHNEYIRIAHDTIFDFTDSELYTYDPPLNQGESFEKYAKRTERRTRRPLDLALGDKWGLAQIEPPITERVGLHGVTFTKRLDSGVCYPNVDFRNDLLRLIENGRANDLGQFAMDTINGLGERLGRPELETVTFDLTLPLNEQIELALSQLKAHKKFKADRGEIRPLERQQYQKNLYKKYLRAYDAKIAGMKPSQIAKFLLPLETNNFETGFTVSAKVSKWIERAIELVENDYRFIPLAANSELKRKTKASKK